IAANQRLKLIASNLLGGMTWFPTMPLPVVVAGNPDPLHIGALKTQPGEVLELARQLLRIPDIAGVEPGNIFTLDAVEQPIAGERPATILRVAEECYWQFLLGRECLDSPKFPLRRTII